MKGHDEIINAIDGVGGLGIGEGAPEIVTAGRDGKWLYTFYCHHQFIVLLDSWLCGRLTHSIAKIINPLSTYLYACLHCALLQRITVLFCQIFMLIHFIK